MHTDKSRLSLCAALCLFAAIGSAGCATVRLNNADRLMARPDFRDAARAAPEWTGEALKTINRLEHDLETK